MPQAPEYKELFNRPGLVDQVKQRQINHWTTFFECRFDENFVSDRYKVGEVHARINLPLNTYIAGMAYSSDWWIKKIASLKLKNEHILTQALNKLFCLETAIVSASYTQATNDLIEKQSRTLMELSIPTIQLWEGILVLPILGIIDSRRAQDMTEVMLTKIQQTSAKSIIIDITGVPTVDSSVANHLIKITKATRLMGCECILSGIGPEIAQTLVHLGINLESIETSANLMSGLQTALAKTGYKVNSHLISGEIKPS